MCKHAVNLPLVNLKNLNSDEILFQSGTYRFDAV